MGIICVTPLGWAEDELTLGAVKKLRAAHRIILRTARCGAAGWLAAQGIPFDSFDDLYDQADDFDELNRYVVSALLKEAEAGDVLYGVNDPGDVSCQALLAAAPERVELSAGVVEGSALGAFAGGGYVQVNAADCGEFRPDASQATLVREIDGAILAGEVKLRLMEAYPEEWEIVVLTAEGRLLRLPLCELDRLASYDHRTCAMVPAVNDFTRKERFTFDDLNRVMRRLRAFDGCPWDREQTHASLRNYLIEEAYEVADAVDSGDMDALCEELGDVLLEAVFHAEIAREHGEFDMADVTTAICRKMIGRHPHVFGGARVERAEDTLDLWEQIKMREKALDLKAQALEKIARSLPALMRAGKALRKAETFGLPVDEAVETPAASKDAEERAGDELLRAAWRAQRGCPEPELALSKAVDRFTARFARMEKAVLASGRALETLPKDELLLLWREAEQT
ncbi:MAG: MazG family protein [Clostridia bacterium]|nr:MazG family protein [Clostridia bacterium]